MHDGFPGADLVDEGLADLSAGRLTASAFLVAIGAPRLRRLGVAVPPDDVLPHGPERRLYELLEREGRGAHSRFNALVRRLVSFERALERERGAAIRRARDAPARPERSCFTAPPQAPARYDPVERSDGRPFCFRRSCIPVTLTAGGF